MRNHRRWSTDGNGNEVTEIKRYSDLSATKQEGVRLNGTSNLFDCTSDDFNLIFASAKEIKREVDYHVHQKQIKEAFQTTADWISK